MSKTKQRNLSKKQNSFNQYELRLGTERLLTKKSVEFYMDLLQLRKDGIIKDISDEQAEEYKQEIKRLKELLPKSCIFNSLVESNLRSRIKLIYQNIVFPVN